MFLQFISNAPGARSLTAVNGTAVTGYSLLAPGWDLGGATWSHEFAGTRGTQGSRPSSAKLENRSTVWTLRIAGTTKDDLAAKKRALEQVVDEMRRFGGQICWQSNSASFRVWFDVKTAGMATAEWGGRAEVINRAVVAVAAVCGPYVEGDPMDVFDTFFTSSIGDYTFDTGLANTTLDNGLGRLYPVAGGGTERRFYHSLSGYRPSDVEVSIGFAVGNVTGFVAGAILRRIDANNYLVAQVDTAAAQLRIKKVIAGVETSLANVAITTLAAGGGSPYWIRFRAEGNNLYAELWVSSPNVGGATNPTSSVAYTLTAGEQPQFGRGVKGQVGARLVPSASGSIAFNFLFSFRSQPYTYRGLKMPRELFLPQIEGDADALADFILNVRHASMTYGYGVVGWTRAPVEPWNLLWNGGLEAQTEFPWSTAAVAGITTAALTVAKTGAIYAGNAGGRFTANTSGQGISHPFFRQLKKGQIYTFEVWLRSNTGATASVVLVLGTPGDGNTTTSAPVTLPASGAWTRLTVPWAPTADREVGYAAIKANATAAYTIDFDAAMVYEGTTPPTAQTHTWGRGATLPFGAVYAGSREDATATLTADAEGFSGYTVQTTPGASATYSFGVGVRIDPYLLWPDDYEKGTIDLEVWVRASFGTDLLNGTARVQAKIQPYVESSVAFYSFLPISPREPGCNPKVVPIGAGTGEWRWLRLGVIPVPAGRRGLTSRMGYQLLVTFSGTAGAGAGRLLKIDHLDLVPARSRFLGGSLGSNYLPIRIVHADLSGEQGVAQSQYAPFWDLTAASGMGGSPLELPSGSDLLLYVRPYAGAPDSSGEGTGDVNAFYTPLDVHLAVKPRWALLRDA
jgi:hypothetical protein